MTFDGVPWQALTAAGGGWALFSLVMYGLITGRWIVTAREADFYLKRAEKAESNVETLVKTVADLTAVGKLQKAVIDAGLRQSGRVPPPEDGDGR